MATNGTSYEAMDSVLLPQFYQALTDASSLQLILYTNAGNSLTKASVLADLVDPSGTGYSRKTLSGVWSSVNGIFTYDDGSPDNISWTNSGGTDWTGAVTGAALISTTYLLHWKDFASGAITVTPGRVITVDLSTLAG